MTKTKPLTAKKLAAAVEKFFYTHGNGVQFDIFDLGKISNAGRAAYATNHDLADVEAAVVAAVAKYRKN